jgi:hypothetical protein
LTVGVNHKYRAMRMGAYTAQEVANEREPEAASARPAGSLGRSVGPVTTRASQDVAAILGLQRTAGNQRTIRVLGLGKSRRPPRNLARCAAHCACTGCSVKNRNENQEDRLSSALRRAVLARSATLRTEGEREAATADEAVPRLSRSGTVGLPRLARGDDPAARLIGDGDIASARGGLLQRQADAGVDNGDAGVEVDPDIRDAGEPLPGGVSQQAPPPPPPDPRDRCRVDVRNTHIGGSLRWAPIWHLYIVHTDEAGRQTGWRGGPGGPGGGGTYGSIIGTSGKYAPGFIDWDPDSDSVTVAMGSDACGKTSCLASELRRIDTTRTPYSPMGPNSNTWVRTVLHSCGLREEKPVWLAPGFGDPYL